MRGGGRASTPPASETCKEKRLRRNQKNNLCVHNLRLAAAGWMAVRRHQDLLVAQTIGEMLIKGMGRPRGSRGRSEGVGDE